MTRLLESLRTSFCFVPVLMFGPIVGCTTDTTTRIWISADGGPHHLETGGRSHGFVPAHGEPTSGRSKLLVYLEAVIDLAGALMFGRSGTGRLGLKDLTDVRDNWANHLVRRERDALPRAVLAVCQGERAVSFIGADLHIGERMGIVERSGARVPTLITSGIGQTPSAGPVAYTVLGRRFRIARGLRARLVEHCVVHNFGLTRIRRGQSAAEIIHELVGAEPHT